MMLIDCVSSPPTDAMRAAGVTGLSRYLSWADSRDTLRKVIHQAEYDQLRAEDFSVLLNWEYYADDWLRGTAQADATEAVRQAKALGYPAGCAIPGSADFNMTYTQWVNAGQGYARIYSTIVRDGGYTPGVYGPWDVLTWCRDAGYMEMFWQAGMSTAWSGGRNAQPWPGAHLRQRYQTYIGGVDCDVNDILQPIYGGAMAGSGITLKWGETLDDYLSRIEQVWVPGATAAAGLPDAVAALKTAVSGLAVADPAAVAAALTTDQIAAGLTAAGITPEAVAAALATHFHVT